MMTLRSILPLLLFTVMVAGACSPNKKQPAEPRQNSTLDSLSLTQIQPPAESKNIKISPVYVDRVRRLSGSAHSGLLIQGNLPNGCAKLMNVQHRARQPDMVELTLESWQPRDAVCTQALVPFKHFYSAIPKDSLDRITRVKVGDRTFSLE